jgi:hypothetical protein
MKGGSNKKNFNKLSRFHYDYEHDIEEYYKLKKEIKRLIFK